MKPVLIKLLCLLSVVLLALTGCAHFAQDFKDNGKGDLSNQGKKTEVAIEVVTTIFPLADIVDNLGGGRVKVIALLPSGASPHTYEPTVEQAKAVAGAELFIFVGGGLDNWILSLAEAENVETLEIMANMEEYLLEYNPLHLDNMDEGEHGDDEIQSQGMSIEAETGTGGYEHGHSHSSYDPHVWMDPVLVKEVIAPLITERLKTIDPESVNHYDNALEKFQKELEALHQEITNDVGKFTKKHFFSYHSAWNYFARRYGLEEVAAVEPFPGKEPSAKWLTQLVRLAEKHQIDILFAEPQLSQKATEVIAAEIKGQVLILDPLGGRGIPGRECYTDLIRYNLEIFREFMK